MVMKSKTVGSARDGFIRLPAEPLVVSGYPAGSVGDLFVRALVGAFGPPDPDPIIDRPRKQRRKADA